MSALSGFSVFEPLFGTFTLKAPPDAPHWGSLLVCEPLQVSESPGEAIHVDSEIRLWFDGEKLQIWQPYREN